MIWNYIKSRAGTIVVFLLLYLTAGIVAALYGLSAVAVGYAGILCTALFLGAGVWDFFSFVSSKKGNSDYRGASAAS